jgi:hypothetical protein
MNTEAALLDEITGTPAADPAPAPDPVPAEPQADPALSPALTPDPQPNPEPQSEGEGRHVPLATFLDARDRAKEAERRLAEMEAKAPKPEAPKAPDPVDDPDGYREFVVNEARAAATQSRFEMSDVIAKQTHGEEAVEAASAWAMERAKADPSFAAQYMREQHPIDWIVRQHKRDAIVSAIPETGIDDWIKAEAEKRGYVLQSAVPVAAPAVVTPPAMTPAPPRSIASDAPAAPPAPGSADFMDIFRK